MTIQRIFVAGAGLMGHGIGQVFASIGRDVVLYEQHDGVVEEGTPHARSCDEQARSQFHAPMLSRDDEHG